MTWGFTIRDSSGNPVFTSDDFSVVFLDSFTVASTDTGSKEYSETLASNVRVAQTQELEAVDIYNITIFNQMDINISLTAGVWTVAWSPGVTITAARDVTIYVLGH